MDINKISNQLNNKLGETKETDKGQKSREVSADKSEKNYSDKVSIESRSMDRNDRIFAKIELEKLNQSSFDKLKETKTKITEYQQAKNVSEEKANQTEIGKMLNDDGVWEKIAEKIVGR